MMSREITAATDFSAGGVSVVGIRELSRSAARVGVAAEDLTELNQRLAAPIISRAKELVPHKTGRLKAGIKAAKSKLAIRVHVGSEKRLPYAGVRHWGLPGKQMPLWLSRAEKDLRTRTLAGYGEGIEKLLKETGWI